MRSSSLLLALIVSMWALPLSAQVDRYQDAVPSSAVSALDDARSLRKSGETASAIDLLESILEESPDYYLAQYNLGLAYLNDSKPDQALPALEKAAKTQQDLGIPEYSIYNTLGWTHLLLADYGAAESNLRKALEHEEENSRATNIRTLNNLGVVMMYSGRFDEAERLFLEAEERYGSGYSRENLELLRSVREQVERAEAAGESTPRESSTAPGTQR